MAALTITPGNVLTVANSGEDVDHGKLAGEAGTAGQAVYLTAAGTWKLAQNDGTALEAAVVGILLHAVATGQPCSVQKRGQITIGATVAAGVAYYTHQTAGSIGPASDLASTNRPAIVGYGVSTTVIQIYPVNFGVALA